MIERVARAIADHEVNFLDYMNTARVVIEAMRKPTAQMVAQTCVWTANPTPAQTAIGLEAMVAMGETNPLGLQAACEVVRDWQTMIDEALAA